VKKIAFAVEKFSRQAGGAESYAVSLASTLVEYGWEVHLYGKTWDGEPSGAIFHKISIPGFLPNWATAVLFAIKHKKMVTAEQFDVIVGFGNTLYMNVYQSHGGVHWYSTNRKVFAERSTIARFIKRFINVISITKWARSWIESAPFRLNPRPRIIAISGMILEDMESFFHVKKNDIDVVYNGVDVTKYNLELQQRLREPLRERLRIPEDDVVFLFISYDLKKKGIVSLVEAASLLKSSGQENFKIIIVGGLPYSSLSRLIKHRGLGDFIIFTGRTPSAEEYYAGSDVFVLPTYYDACSLVVIEAMACGLPSITTTYNGVSGIMTDGKDGFIIPHPPDPADLADRMRLLMIPERREQMSQEASHTGKMYTTERNHEEMMAIFHEVANSTEKRPE
jgi:UDP-glucose:(heptosyl)LPS alpha-1,3-glucosyltransferase